MSDQQGPELWQTVLDSLDARAAAEFYRQLLSLKYRTGDEPPGPGQDDTKGRSWLVLEGPAGHPRIAFQQTGTMAPTTWPRPDVPQQLHLDIRVGTTKALDAQHARALALGASLVSDQSDDDEPLRVYADLDGHTFCIFVRDLGAR